MRFYRLIHSLSALCNHIITFGNPVKPNCIKPKPTISTLSSNVDIALLTAILDPLVYYDCFAHPLQLDELANYASAKVSMKSLEQAVYHFVNRGIIAKTGDYYHLHLPAEAIVRRQDAEQLFDEKMALANRMSQTIATFPFIQCVCLSGSMSKGVAYPGGDIDFFIITKDDKLWVSRLLLFLYKKLFLFRHRKDFCLNYFIEEGHLELEDKNIFTATELVTIMPMYGYDVYEKLLETNSWLSEYYPNVKRRTNASVISPKSTAVRKLLTAFSSNRLFDFFGHQFMKLVWSRYNKKQATPLTDDELRTMYKVKKHVSKIHNSGNQKILLDKLERKKQNFLSCFISSDDPT